MQFKMQEIKKQYAASNGWEREVGKWAFSILTLGFGGLYLLGSTKIIADGEIGIRETLNGDMILLPPGRHSNFPWESYPCPAQKISNPRIEMGPYKIFTVPTGNVAETYDKGELKTFGPGQYIISDQAHTVARIVSTKMETQKLHKVQAYTQDNVGLTLQADVRYAIKDPKLAIAAIGDIEKYIIETAEMKIANVVGHHTLSEFAPAISRFEDNKGKGEHVEKHSGISMLLHELTRAIKDQFEALGIFLDNIGITSWNINDKQLAHELAQGAVVNSQTQSKMITASNEANVATIRTQTEASRIAILATAEADALKTKGKAISEVASMLTTPAAQQIYHNNQNIAMVSQAKNANLFFSPESGKQPKLVANLPLTLDNPANNR